MSLQRNDDTGQPIAGLVTSPLFGLSVVATLALGILATVIFDSVAIGLLTALVTGLLITIIIWQYLVLARHIEFLKNQSSDLESQLQTISGSNMEMLRETAEVTRLQNHVLGASLAMQTVVDQFISSLEMESAKRDSDAQTRLAALDDRLGEMSKDLTEARQMLEAMDPVRREDALEQLHNFANAIDRLNLEIRGKLARLRMNLDQNS